MRRADLIRNKKRKRKRDNENGNGGDKKDGSKSAEQVLESNRVAAKAYRKRKGDKEATLRERVSELEQLCKSYKQTLLQNGIADPVLQTSHF